MNNPAQKPQNLKHIKARFIEVYAYNRFRAHNYEVDAEYISETEDVRWINLKTGLPFFMLVTETGIELLQDPECAASSDQAFVAQIETEGVFEPSCSRLIAKYDQALDDLLPAIVPYLTESQLVECLRSQPCSDPSWIERGYI